MQLKLASALFVVFAIAAPVDVAHGQAFPTKPVKVLTPFPAGSGPDSALRMVADKLSKSWGQQVLVENRPGANGFIALGAAKAAPRDGYTLAQASSAQLTTHRLLNKSLPYDPVKDFEPLPLSPGEMAALMEADTKRYADTIKRLNLSLE